MSSKSRRQGQASGPSQRQLRVGESLRHALSEILMREDFFDPDLANVSITISEISVSPDLRNWQEPDPNFVENVKKEIKKENPVLVSCAAGGRSLIAANLLEQEGYKALNVSDGFSGNGQDPGWKNSGLPTK